MTTWELTTAYKKSSIERQFWYKDDKVIIREEGYRWSTFTCECDKMPLTMEELRNEDDCYELDYVDDDNSWEMLDMTDGCWADTEAGRNCTEEDLEEFNNAWEENYYEGVEELGWFHDDTEYFMTGPLILKNVDTGQEFSGLVDPATVVHTIELPVDVAPELASIVDEQTKWPFATEPLVEEPAMTDWYPVEINPYRIGVYEIQTNESINFPHPNKAKWDGKKWNFLDHTVTYWRGLAKDPETK